MQPERLNEETRKGCDSPTSTTKGGEGDPKRFPRLERGHKSNRMTEITRSDVDEVVRALKNSDAYTIMDNIEGEDKFGTAPTRDAYFALCSSNLTGNLDLVGGFIHKNQYPDQ